MSEEIEFFVDGKPFCISKSELTVADILSLVEVSPDQSLLVSEDGTELRERNDVIKINSGDRFKTKESENEAQLPASCNVSYKVNGEEQTAQKSSLTVREILQNAGEGASIDLSQIDSYFLEDLATGQKYENADDEVCLKDGDTFLAVHVGATPVA